MYDAADPEVESQDNNLSWRHTHIIYNLLEEHQYKATYKERSETPVTFIGSNLYRSKSSTILYYQFLLCACIYKYSADLHISLICSPMQRGTT